MGRLPAEAQAVFEEIVKKCHDTIKETKIERRERIDKRFQDLLMMGKNLSHAVFRTEFDDILEDMRDAEMQIPDEETLFRKSAMMIPGPA